MNDDPTLGAWDGNIPQAMINEADEKTPNEAESQDRFLVIVRLSCLPDGADFYPWLLRALITVHEQRKEPRIHVLQSTTGDGKTVIAYGEIIARCYAHRLTAHKAFFTVPYRRLTREKGEELREVFTVLRGRPIRPNEIHIVEGKRPVRDITLTRVVIGTFEHTL
jgi:hypothetical protein